MAPLPTDRFIFDYSYFHNVPLGYRSMPVNRFTPGLEKAFFGKRASVEFRFPFATTIDSTLYSNNANAVGRLRVGDMTAIFKYLFYKGEKVALTAGFGLSAPLADGMQLRDSGTGNEIVRWKNATWHIMPYVGLFWTPSDRAFFQAYFQVDTAANGDPIYIADMANGTGDLFYAGRVTDRTHAYTSLALGYWLFKEKDAHNRMKRGLNLIGELHWTQSLDRTRGVQYEQGNYRFNVGEDRGNYTILNMTVGTRYLMNEKTSIGLGMATPLRSQRQFDGELRLTLNRYF